MEQVKDTDKKIIFDPPLDSEIDPSSIISLSLFGEDIVLITKDYKIKILTKNDHCPVRNSLIGENHEGFTEFEIKDDQNYIYYPISSYLSNRYLLCIVSEVERGSKTYLVYFYNYYDEKFNNEIPYPIFIDTGNSYPISLYGNGNESIAIDTNGAILYINCMVCWNPSNYVEPQYLPDGEKAVNVAMCFDHFYVLSFNGKLFIKKGESIKKPFKKVKKFKKIKIVQISAMCDHILVLTEENKVFTCGENSDGKLGIGYKKENVRKFTEILTLREYIITNVYAGFFQSFFQTNNGEILCCGQNSSKEENLIPVSTSIKSGANFCVLGNHNSAVFINSDAEMSPNRRIKDEIKIVLFGGEGKTEILHKFINNNIDNLLTNNAQIKDEFNIQIEIDNSLKVSMKIFDSPSLNDNYYQLAFNLLFFFDLSYPQSINDFGDWYKNVCNIWGSQFKFAVVAYDSNFLSNKQEKSLPQSTKDLILNLQCEIFEINSKDIESINKPFYYFLYQNYKITKEILKIGKEHRNLFNNIKKNQINIGLFGSTSVNKTDLAFRYVYEDLYEHFYEDYKKNYTDIELTKIVEINNENIELSVIDSSFIKNIDDSYYSAVQGIIFVFGIDILLTTKYIDSIQAFYSKAKESVKNDLNFVIALKLEENQQNTINFKLANEKINCISTEFNCNVFIFSTKTGENVESIFYCLAKQIITKQKQKNRLLKKKKRHHKIKL